MAADPPMTSDVQAVRERLEQADATLPEGPWELWTSCSYRRITGPDGKIGGVLHAYNQRSDGHPDLSMPEHQLRALVNLRNALPAIRDALAAAEERAATAERERDEARALAAERLEALRPFAAVFHGRHMKDDPPPTLVGLLVGVTARHMAAVDLDGLSCDHFRRAAALTSGADHGG